jgi:hypothetical protein
MVCNETSNGKKRGKLSDFDESLTPMQSLPFGEYL